MARAIKAGGYAEAWMRTAAAIFGGYGFTYSFTAALARLLPMADSEAVIVATLPSFLVYGLAMLWAYGCCSVRRAWALLLPAIPLAVFAFWPQVRSALA